SLHHLQHAELQGADGQSRRAHLHGLVRHRRRIRRRRPYMRSHSLPGQHPMSNSDALVIEGRVWLFPDDNLNTDLMMPQTVFGKPLEVQLRAVFATYRSGWVDEVGAGDILESRRDFRTGSIRSFAAP